MPARENYLGHRDPDAPTWLDGARSRRRRIAYPDDRSLRRVVPAVGDASLQRWLA